MTTRRTFFAGAASMATAIASPSALASNSVITSQSRKLQGILYGFGINGKLHPAYQRKPNNTASVLTSVSLSDGAVRQTALEMGFGHSAIAATGGNILCIGHHGNKSMMVDASHKEIASFITPEGYLFGGHGLVIPERNIFLLTMKNAAAKTLDDHGFLMVYDLKTFKNIDRIDTGGLHPHEIHKVPGTNEYAVTHYGDVVTPNPPFAFNSIEPKLTILDAETFLPKRHYQQSDINKKALSTHMRVDSKGWAYFVSSQYVNLWQIPPALARDQMAAGLDAIKNVYGIDIDFALPHRTLLENQISVPLLFVRVNTQTGERQIISAGHKNHLRSQSVAINKATDTAIALYTHSDNLVLHRDNKEPEVIKAAQLDLGDLRGVTDIPGTTCIAVCGANFGITVFDLASREIVTKFQTENFESTHLYHDAEFI